MIKLKLLLDNYYHLINNSTKFKSMTPGQCREKAQVIKEKINVIKEEYKDNQELYDLLIEFCDNGDK